MKKTTLTALTILVLTLTACSGASRSSSTSPVVSTQNGSAAGTLPAATQLAIGTLKLEDTDQAVTAEQAAELLPLWQTLQVLYDSDTAAEQEIEALTTQIQETMTTEQTEAITAMNLTRQDMMTMLQDQGIALGGGSAGEQNNNAQSNSTTGNNNSGGFAPGGGFGPGGGAPPDGGFPAGGFGGGQGSGLSQDQIATAQASRPAGSANIIPSPLINALIEFLKQKAGL